MAKGADTWQYTYDALGNRVATTENSSATRYVIDPIGLGNVVGEYDAIGDLIARALEVREDEAALARIKTDVIALADAFPLYAKRSGAAPA